MFSGATAAVTTTPSKVARHRSNVSSTVGARVNVLFLEKMTSIRGSHFY
jgi:hypothetical protein